MAAGSVTPPFQSPLSSPSAAVAASPSSPPFFSSDFEPRPLPPAARKSHTDLGLSSIRSSKSPSTMMSTRPASAVEPNFSVITTSKQVSQNRGFKVQRRSSGAGYGFGQSSVPSGSGSSSLAENMPGKRKATHYAVAVGHKTGVFDSWAEAEEQIKGHPCPQWKTFRTRLAAESYILSASPFATTEPADADTGAYDMQLDYPSSSKAAGSSLGAPLNLSPKASTSSLPKLEPPRPPFARTSSSSSSNSGSPVKRSSPLRQEVTDDEASDHSHQSEQEPPVRLGPKKSKHASMISRLSAGFLSPPTSPEAVARTSKTFRVESVERSGLAPPIVLPASSHSPSQSRSSSRNADRPVRPVLKTSSTGNLTAPYDQRPGAIRNASASSLGSSAKSQKSAPGGLWGDATPPLTPPMSPVASDRYRSMPGSPSKADGFDYIGSTSTPKFSRSAIKKMDVPMPISAKQLASSKSTTPTLSRQQSSNSLRQNGMPTHLNLLGSSGSFGSLREKLHAVQNTTKLQDSDKENNKVQTQPQRPVIDTDVHAHAVQDMSGPPSPASFKTAMEEHHVSPQSPSSATSLSRTGPPLSSKDETSPIATSSTSDHQLGDAQHLSPIPSHASGSDDYHGSTSAHSDATHTQSEACTGKYGDDRRLGKRRSLKKLMKVLGFSKVKTDDGLWDRRSST